MSSSIPSYHSYILIGSYPLNIGGEEVLREGVWGNRRRRSGSGCVLLPEMIASEKRWRERIKTAVP